MSERVISIGRRKLSDPPDSGLSVPGTPQDRVALVATLTAEAWSLAGLRIPEYDRASTPIHIRSLRAAPLTDAR
jgi:hypothetical protein